MKIKLLLNLTVALATVSFFFVSCEDDVSNIGNSISSTEITISVDSLSYKLDASTFNAPDYNGGSIYTLLGSLKVPEYGTLQCSYVTQFLPVEKLEIPDSIKIENIDSVKLFVNVPKNYITGDSLAPQQYTAYKLTKQLPSVISSSFNPEGYYNDKDKFASKSYTLSGYTFNDSTFINNQRIGISARLPIEFGRSIYQEYLNNPDIFIWPEKFAQFFPGIYVEPSFGKGCVAPVESTEIFLYYPKTIVETKKDEDGNETIVYVQKADSICAMTSAPEVITNVNISYSPSDYIKDMIADGKNIISTPGGHVVSIKFPAEEILEQYWDEKFNLGVINNMVFKLPAKPINNDYGLGLPPSLLMIKSTEIESFFENGELPDDKTSFYSFYSTETNTYTFSSMREYIVALRDKGKGNITEEDITFTLIPVSITTEEYTDYSTGKLITVVTSIMPYIIKPTMGLLDTDNAIVVFTYSNQTLN